MSAESSTPPAFDAFVTLFHQEKYLAAHEVLDDLWEQTQGERSDFYKGLIQAAIALHHFQEGNLEGAAKLYKGHRRFLAAYLPNYLGWNVADFLASMQTALRPVVRARAGEQVDYATIEKPRLERA